ncbi:MAG: FkbM family methyltransferase [Opitutaceae bacterium]|jgi:FkbM family methyltransferase
MRDPIVPPILHAPSWKDRLVTHFRRHKWRGFVRLYDLLKPVTARRALRVTTRYGSQFFLTPWDSVDHHVVMEGFYESEVLEAVRPQLGTDKVLWVIGANFGLHTVTAKWLHPVTRVVAFEPSPAMAARLLENCELNAVDVDLHAYALSDRAGAFPFFANNSCNPGMSTLYPQPGGPYENRFTVATLTAAAVIDDRLAPPPNAIILDAEGSEEPVLRGFGRHLSDPGLTHIVVEAPNDFLTSRKPEGLYSLLDQAGFELNRLERNENTAHTLSNFLAVRRPVAKASG